MSKFLEIIKNAKKNNLDKLNLSACNLSEIPKEVFEFIQLKELYLGFNKITSISREIGNLTQLKILSLVCNQLTSLPDEIGNLTQLKILYLNNNRLTSLPFSLINCRRLEFIEYFTNEIEYIPPQLLRVVNNTIQKVYSDSQNVHNHSIQEGIRKGIEYISSVKPNLTFDKLKENILDNLILSEESKSLIFEYIESKEVHSLLNITFVELLLNVYSIALKSKDKEEIFKIMDNEMTDSQCKCFTGRLSRLVNCLNGFDENIKINISDNEQIGNIILLIRNKYTDISQIKEEVRKELTDRRYSTEVINIWVDYIE